MFTTTSVYCVKYLLWRKLHVPIQNLSLALASQNDADLADWLEIRRIINLEEPSQKSKTKPTIQQFLDQKITSAINVDLVLAVVPSQHSKL